MWSVLEFKPYRGVLASYRYLRVIFLKSDDLIYITDTMTWSKPAVHNMIPLPRSLHSATTIGKRFVTCHLQLLYMYLAKAVCLLRNTFSHGVPVSNSGLIHQECHRKLRDCLLLYKHQWNTRWAFTQKLDIFTCENITFAMAT